MPSESVSLYRFGWQDSLGKTRQVVWVVDEAEERGPYARSLEGVLAQRYSVAADLRQDGLGMRVDLEPDRAAEWRAAAIAYLTELGVAERGWRDARTGRAPLFQKRETFLARARARYEVMASAAEAAYAPARWDAWEFLERADAPRAEWQRKLTEADALRWAFEQRSATTRVRYDPGGQYLQSLLDTIEHEREIPCIRWEPSAVAKIEEILGKGQFDAWWTARTKHWQYVLWVRRENREKRDRYRPGGTGTAGTGGFGI